MITITLGTRGFWVKVPKRSSITKFLSPKLAKNKGQNHSKRNCQDLPAANKHKHLKVATKENTEGDKVNAKEETETSKQLEDGRYESGQRRLTKIPDVLKAETQRMENSTEQSNKRKNFLR